MFIEVYVAPPLNKIIYAPKYHFLTLKWKDWLSRTCGIFTSIQKIRSFLVIDCNLNLTFFIEKKYINMT